MGFVYTWFTQFQFGVSSICSLRFPSLFFPSSFFMALTRSCVSQYPPDDSNPLEFRKSQKLFALVSVHFWFICSIHDSRKAIWLCCRIIPLFSFLASYMSRLHLIFVLESLLKTFLKKCNITAMKIEEEPGRSIKDWRTCRMCPHKVYEFVRCWTISFDCFSFFFFRVAIAGEKLESSFLSDRYICMVVQI